MSNPDLSPADLTDTAASLAADTELAHLLCIVDRAQEDRQEAPGPAEEILALIAALHLCTRAAETTHAAARGARLLLAEALCHDALRTLASWRLATGCDDWTAVTWTAETLAVAEVQAQLDLARARLIRAASASEPAVAERLSLAA